MPGPQKEEPEPSVTKSERASPNLRDQAAAPHLQTALQPPPAETPPPLQPSPPETAPQRQTSSVTSAANIRYKNDGAVLQSISKTPSISNQQPTIAYGQTYYPSSGMTLEQSPLLEHRYPQQRGYSFPPQFTGSDGRTYTLIPQQQHYQPYMPSAFIHVPSHSAYEAAGYRYGGPYQQGHSFDPAATPTNSTTTYGGGPPGRPPLPQTGRAKIRATLPQTSYGMEPPQNSLVNDPNVPPAQPFARPSCRRATAEVLQPTPGTNRKRKLEHGTDEGQPWRVKQSHHDNTQHSRNKRDTRPGYGYQLFFSNREEAMRGVTTPEWSAPRNDPTLPNSSEARQEWVRKLVRAFLDISQCQDRPGPVFKRRWFDPKKPQQGYKDFYDRRAVEKMCWDIVDMAENLHRKGPKTFSCYDPSFQKTVAKTQSLTFSDRVSRLIELFSKFKARCDKMFKSSVLETYVADPETMLQTAYANRGANDNRQKYIQQGRGDIKGKKVLSVQQSSTLKLLPGEYSPASHSTGGGFVARYNSDGGKDDFTDDDAEEEEEDTSMEIDDIDTLPGFAQGSNAEDAEGDTDPELSNTTNSVTGKQPSSILVSDSGAIHGQVDENYSGDEKEVDASLNDANAPNEDIGTSLNDDLGSSPLSSPPPNVSRQ